MNVTDLIEIIKNETLRNLFSEEELNEMLSTIRKETIDYISQKKAEQQITESKIAQSNEIASLGIR